MEEKSDFKPKCITIRKDQDEFLQEEKDFKLSRFVQLHLDDWIKFRKQSKQFCIEVENEEAIK